MNDLLTFSLLFALGTFIHNKLYRYNKTLFVVIIFLLVMSFLYRFVPSEIWYEVHIWMQIIIVWSLLVYTFFLARKQHLANKGLLDRRSHDDK